MSEPTCNQNYYRGGEWGCFSRNELLFPYTSKNVCCGTVSPRPNCVILQTASHSSTRKRLQICKNRRALLPTGGFEDFSNW